LVAQKGMGEWHEMAIRTRGRQKKNIVKKREKRAIKTRGKY